MKKPTIRPLMAQIRKARLKWKHHPGAPSFADEMSAYKKEEIEREEAKLKRCGISLPS
jgi:hypothetical protein